MVSRTLVTARVLAITPASVSVRLADGRVVAARNALNARCPPRSLVLVSEVEDAYAIVGRPR